MLRRTFLQLLGSFVVTLTATKLPEPAIAVTKELRPTWCPEGFLPCDGRAISKEKYPALFEIIKRPNGRNFYPKFFNKVEAELPDLLPWGPDEIKRAGFQDNLTRTAPLPDVLAVPVIAVENITHSNGRVAPAGFIAELAVKREDYLKDYDSVKYAKSSFAYAGYEEIVPRVV